MTSLFMDLLISVAIISVVYSLAVAPVLPVPVPVPVKAWRPTYEWHLISCPGVGFVEAKRGCPGELRSA